MYIYLECSVLLVCVSEKSVSLLLVGWRWHHDERIKATVGDVLVDLIGSYLGPLLFLFSSIRLL